MSREGSEARMAALRLAQTHADAIRELEAEIRNRMVERDGKSKLDKPPIQDRIDRMNNVILRLGGELKYR